MSVKVSEAKKQIEKIINNAAAAAVAEGLLPEAELSAFKTESTKNREHGDYAVNAAMVWARAFRKAPRAIAEILLDKADFTGTYIERAEIAGPGFINFFLKDSFYSDIVLDVLGKKENYGKSEYGENIE